MHSCKSVTPIGRTTRTTSKRNGIIPLSDFLDAPRDFLDAPLGALARALAGEGPAVEFLPPTAPRSHANLEFASDAPAETGAVVRTSGSTGMPKRTALSVAALAANTQITAEFLGFEGQWLLALPLNYVAGLTVLTRGLFAGTRPVATDPGVHFDAELFNRTAAGMTDRYRITSLVPTQLQRLLTNPSPETLATLKRFDALLIGGGRTPEWVRDAARAEGLNIFLTYGSAETTGGCVYNGAPLPGVSVREEDGRLWLGGPTIATGYLNDPARTAEHFREFDGERWYVTDDLGTFRNGTVSVTGRIDDVINSAGIKISASHVQQFVEAFPGVTSALVVPVPHPEWGQSVGLALSGDYDDAGLLSAIRSQLGGACVPKFVWHVDALPLLGNGKPDRLAITEELARHPR